MIDGRVISILGDDAKFYMFAFDTKDFGTILAAVESRNILLKKRIKVNNRLSVNGEMSSFAKASGENGMFHMKDRKLGKVYFFADRGLYDLLCEWKESEKIRNPPSHRKNLLQRFKK